MRLFHKRSKKDEWFLVYRSPFMSPAEQLLRERITCLATTVALEWMAESYALLLRALPPDLQSRARMEMKSKLQSARQEQNDLLDRTLPAAQARLQAAWFREAFDEAAATVEQRLGLGPPAESNTDK